MNNSTRPEIWTLDELSDHEAPELLQQGCTAETLQILEETLQQRRRLWARSTRIPWIR